MNALKFRRAIWEIVVISIGLGVFFGGIISIISPMFLGFTIGLLGIEINFPNSLGLICCLSSILITSTLILVVLLKLNSKLPDTIPEKDSPFCQECGERMKFIKKESKITKEFILWECKECGHQERMPFQDLI